MAEWYFGTVAKSGTKYGFVQQDSGEPDLFMMPVQCVGFDGRLPPPGTRVAYNLGVDAQKGQPTADNVHAEDAILSMSLCTHAGTVKSVNGNFGFITQDTGEDDMFMLPLQCTGFGGNLPNVGTRVVYIVGTDPKTGKPRAEEVHPEQGTLQIQERPPVSTPRIPRPTADLRTPTKLSGTISGNVVNSSSKFGFIQQDSGEGDLFVMPAECTGFGGCLPPGGTRVTYVLGVDPQKGRPRAEEVEAEIVQQPRPSFVRPRPSVAQPRPSIVQPQVTSWSSSWQPARSVSSQRAGTMMKDNGKFGFIQQDSGEEDLFVMPNQCAEFGGALPPIGCRVVYEVAADPKTGRPRAENVVPEMVAATFRQPSFPSAVRSKGGVTRQVQRRPAGTMLHMKENGSFGFIQQDSGEPDLFVMPNQCEAFGNALPPVGSRVEYEVTADPKTGRPRAEDVQPEQTGARLPRPVPSQSAGMHGKLAGTMQWDNGKFGFIKQDSGEDDLFVMPNQCEAFGGQLPAMGTRLTYEIVLDAKTGRPRAEDVQPEHGAGGSYGPQFAGGKGKSVRVRPF
eukprot:TRINITY_DN64637_c0_g1_i1.p1 TRINITY_DN64637_c0_g1~~TRINITY_DN64637_c0_g1_i1.p1  ORF type:complete len:562 (-),score=90.49 TRINITY_DN64637_c0_g1_i1:35-1720(-)